MKKLFLNLLTLFLLMIGGLSATAVAESPKEKGTKGTFMVGGAEFSPIEVETLKNLIERGGIDLSTSDVEFWIEDSTEVTKIMGTPMVIISLLIVTSEDILFEEIISSKSISSFSLAEITVKDLFFNLNEEEP